AATKLRREIAMDLPKALSQRRQPYFRHHCLGGMTPKLIYSHHHAACLDDGVSCLAFFELKLVWRFVGYRGSDDLSADIDANMGRSDTLFHIGDLTFELIACAHRFMRCTHFPGVKPCFIKITWPSDDIINSATAVLKP